MSPERRRRRPRPSDTTTSPSPVDSQGRPRGRPHSGGTNGGIRPVDLHQVIGHTPIVDEHGRTIGTRPETMIDRAVAVCESGGFQVDVAARLGVRVDTLRTWLRTGSGVARELAQGTRTEGSLSTHERQCLELEFRTWQAEQSARMSVVELAQRLMQGVPQEVTLRREVVGLDGKVTVEESTRRTVTPPDSGMVRWWLSHRYPEQFGDRVEVTGPGGGPVIDTERPVAVLRDLLGRLAGAQARAASLPIPGANGHHQEAATDA